MGLAWGGQWQSGQRGQGERQRAQGCQECAERGGAGGACLCGVVGQTFAGVDWGAGVDADALERDTEDMRIGLGGADARRIDNG